MEPNNDDEQNAPPHRQRPSPTADHHQHASNADLLNSAKYLAGAAFNRDSSNKVDTGRAAGAAADLLDAASHYAHIEEKSFGKYVDQAEDYLHKYQSSHSTTTPGAGHAPPSKDDSSSGGGGGGGGGGYGDYIKMAQGFLKK